MNHAKPEFPNRNVVMGASKTTRVVLIVFYVALANCEPCHRPVNLPLANLKVCQADSIHSSPLVRSTFCSMKIDHISWLTLYVGYWFV